MRNQILENAILEYQMARAEESAAKSRKDAAAGIIKAEMEKCNMVVYVGESGKATYKPVTSNPVDTKALKAEMPEVAERYTVQRTTKPLKVS